MSREDAAELPDAVITGLSDTDRPRDQATLLLTVDEDGVPRTSMLSAAEILVIGPRRLSIALWADGRTAANVARTGSALLFRVDDGAPRSIRLQCAAPEPLDVAGPHPLVAVDAAVCGVQTDRVGYADVVGALEFALREPDAVLPLWRDVRRALAARR